MSRALGVELAAQRAGAALDAAAGVAADRAAARAEGTGALHAELSVSAHALGIEGSDGKHLLGARVEGVEIIRPGDPLALAPLLEDLRGRPKAGPGVDHGGAPDCPSDRDR